MGVVAVEPGNTRSLESNARFAFFSLLLTLVGTSALADHTADPAGVALVGNLQSELGCPGDWQPECSATELFTTDGIVWSATFAVPAGLYEYKVALNDGWDENYGAGGAAGGANIRLSVASPSNVTFTYDHRSHVIADNLVPASVTIAGSLQSELGCPGDWDPTCAATFLGLDLSDGIWQQVFNLPAGDWEYKAVINADWYENYGANATPNGGNIGMSLGSATDVKFYYDDATNWITSNQNALIATAPGSFQSELGCPGDWQPDCLRSWLQDPDGDGIYGFETRAIPAGDYETKVAYNESWSENYGAGGVPGGANIPFSVAADGALVVFSYNPDTRLLDIASEGPKGNVTEARAYWLAEDTIAWNVAADSAVRLHYSADASLAVTVDGVIGGDSIALTPDGIVDGEIADKFRHLAGLPVYRIGAGDLPLVPEILKGQFAVAARDAAGDPRDATALQPAGVLDDLYTYDGALGTTFDGNSPTVRVWAPTAKSVNLHLFADSSEMNPAVDVIAMTADHETGTWSVSGNGGWNRMYYLFEVEVYARYSGAIETFLVTDPYSLGLSENSQRSQIVNLDDHDLKPWGWDSLHKPRLRAPEDIVLYELHVRDFSMHDPWVPEHLRGTFRAFNLFFTRGSLHLRRLARAGLTHVHVLPAFDCATIDEDRSTHADPGDLSNFAPNGEEQQAAIDAIRDEDGFNWCYDPQHYTTPEGSYATDADGAARILEFREMVAGLNHTGLRTVMDVVYNHTSGSLGSDNSVLDRIVPDYYHRLNDAGYIEMSSCCANTATEHNMMEKLMLDSLRVWATDYKVDGFRFDLMGHHSRANIENARDMLQSLTIHEDGVDGRSIYLYGEGWNFGEVANNARFEQATQANMGDGTGVGSFNDRIRDAVRGGGPFDTGDDHIRRQGFINGLYYDPNALNSGAEWEREELLRLTDWLRIGLAGSIEDFQFVDRNGNLVTAGTVDYFGNPGAGYTSDPQEAINYAAAHDNETLFDVSQYKLPVETSTADRIRVVNMANSLVLLGQGVPFLHAGQELLRSKSMDRNSYNSGDWFNILDFTGSDNGWGRGMPPFGDNQSSWPQINALLGNPALDDIGRRDVRRASRHVREMLRIRRSSPLFRLHTGEDVMESLEFHNTGPSQIPGLIVMSLRGDEYVEMVVLFNASTEDQSFDLDVGQDCDFDLHRVQERSGDRTVRDSWYDEDNHTFHVPARTTAVFVAGD